MRSRTKPSALLKIWPRWKAPKYCTQPLKWSWARSSSRKLAGPPHPRSREGENSHSPVSKQLVWQAYKRVKANRGAAGVDGESLEVFDKGLKGNLYKIWNRMASGSYFPPPVRRVEIPENNGGTRPLGIPTVGDRIAQTVVKMLLEPLVEPHFHKDSYGYRPGSSALDAVGTARMRCWRADWVIDLDIKGFFDNLGVWIRL